MAGYLGSKTVLLSTTAAVVTGDMTVAGATTVNALTATGDIVAGGSGTFATAEIIGNSQPLTFTGLNATTTGGMTFNTSTGVNIAMIDVTGNGDITLDADPTNVLANTSIHLKVDGANQLVVKDTGVTEITGRLDISEDVTIGDDLHMTGPDPKIFMNDSDGVDQQTQVFQSAGVTYHRSRNGLSDGSFLFQGYGGGSTTNHLKIESNGDVKFYEDTGTTADFLWDASASSLTLAGDVIAQDEFRAEVVAYAANQDAPYMIAATTGYTGATTNWGTYGYQHRFKSDGGGVGRVTIDTPIGEAFSVKATSGSMIVTAEDELHALGGIHLGGTAAANKLDDYEEGTWTPAISDGTNVGTASIAVGSYTKIGNHVHVQGRIVLTSLGWVTGSIRLTGLPFATQLGSHNFSAMTIGRATGLNLTAGTNVIGDLRVNATHVILAIWDITAGTSNMQATEFSANGDIAFSMDYLSN